ncbi:MAG: hypothetical protein WC237_03360 [Candidatus Paceibacterota bacterium]
MKHRYHGFSEKKGRRARRQLQRCAGSILYEVALISGDRAEQLVIEAFDKAMNENRIPDWLYNWKRQPRLLKNDSIGIDIVFMTEEGPVFIQVKSSRIRAIEFHSKHPNSNIRVVVVNILDDWLTIFGKVIAEVDIGYQQLVQQASPA